MNIDPISAPKTMMPAHAATQKIRRPAMSSSSLPEHEGDTGDDGDAGHDRHDLTRARYGREVDPDDERAHEEHGQDTAEVVDRLRALVHVRRHELPGEQQRDDGEGQREQEDRAPPEVLEQEAGQQRPQRGDGRTDAGPQRDGLGAAGA
jgi:hypothetical protein